MDLVHDQIHLFNSKAVGTRDTVAALAIMFLCLKLPCYSSHLVLNMEIL